MKFRVKAKAKVSWVNDRTESLQSKTVNIDEIIESATEPGQEKARSKIEGMKKHQHFTFQWKTMLDISRVDD